MTLNTNTEKVRDGIILSFIFYYYYLKLAKLLPLSIRYDSESRHQNGEAHFNFYHFN